MDKFLRFLRERKLSAKKLFEEIDRDGSGEIDVNEVRGYLKEHKGRLNENEVFMVMVRLDPERKGVITRKVF
jgi:Ca2+-binding EF-hand superfamily protein